MAGSVEEKWTIDKLDGSNWIRNNKGKLCGMGSLVEKLYQLDCEPTSIIQASVAVQAKDELNLWHQ